MTYKFCVAVLSRRIIQVNWVTCWRDHDVFTCRSFTWEVGMLYNSTHQLFCLYWLLAPTWPFSSWRIYYNCRSIFSTDCWGSLCMVAGKTLSIGLNTYMLNPNGHQFFLFAQYVSVAILVLVHAASKKQVESRKTAVMITGILTGWLSLGSQILALRVAICNENVTNAIYRAAWVENKEIAQPAVLFEVSLLSHYRFCSKIGEQAGNSWLFSLCYWFVAPQYM